MDVTVGGKAAGSVSSPTIRAIALVGFYRGELVEPGQLLDLTVGEFAELKAFCKVDYAPAVEETPPAVADATETKRAKK